MNKENVVEKKKWIVEKMREYIEKYVEGELYIMKKLSTEKIENVEGWLKEVEKYKEKYRKIIVYRLGWYRFDNDDIERAIVLAENKEYSVEDWEIDGIEEYEYDDKYCVYLALETGYETSIRVYPTVSHPSDMKKTQYEKYSRMYETYVRPLLDRYTNVKNRYEIEKLKKENEILREKLRELEKNVNENENEYE